MDKLRFVNAGLVLALFACIAIALLGVSALSTGGIAAWSIIAIGLFNAIMFPTIFSLAVEGLDSEAPKASGLLGTVIVGCAIVPLITGATADAAGLSASLLIPSLCYGIIAAFGVYTLRVNVVAGSSLQS